MKLNKFYQLFALISLFAAAACNGDKQPNNKENAIGFSEIKQYYQKPLIEMNRDMIAVQDEMIQGYISRHQWEMEQTGSGLYYQIYQEGKGENPGDGSRVEFAYTMWLLDGTLLYTSDSTGNREILIGHNNDEAGIDEGLRLMKPGAKARFILHPHLAFGVPGDGYKVPYRAILVYDIELISIKNEI